MAAAQEELVVEDSADPAERRRHARVELPLRARFLSGDGEERPCLVVNVSAGGALCRTVSPPAENETVVLYIDQIGRFEGRVARAGRHSFAVDYRGRRTKSNRTADALTVALHRRPRIDQRAAPRIRQDAPAQIVFENGDTQPCSILDISLTGASLQIEPRPPLGAQVTLGKMAAKVVRRHETGVGVVFLGPARRLEERIEQTAGALADANAGAALAGGFGRKGATA